MQIHRFKTLFKLLSVGVFSNIWKEIYHLDSSAICFATTQVDRQDFSCTPVILFSSINFNHLLSSYPHFTSSPDNCSPHLVPWLSQAVHIPHHSTSTQEAYSMMSFRHPGSHKPVSNHSGYPSVTQTNTGNDSHPTNQFDKARANKSML